MSAAAWSKPPGRPAAAKVAARKRVHLTSEITPFAAVSAEFAAAEGEGDRSLEYWRQAHQRFFSRELAAFGRMLTPERPVVCERFEVVYAP